jgi:hypothetical protein
LLDTVQARGDELHELRLAMRSDTGLELLKRHTRRIDALQYVGDILYDGF